MDKIVAEYTELVKEYCSLPSDATIAAIESFEAAHPELVDTHFGAIFMNVPLMAL